MKQHCLKDTVVTFLFSLRIVVDIFFLLPWIFEKHAYSLSHWQFDNSLIPQYGKYESRASRWWAYSLLYPRGVSAAFQLSYKNPRCVSVMLLCNQYSCLNREHNTFCLNCISRNASFFFFFSWGKNQYVFLGCQDVCPSDMSRMPLGNFIRFNSSVYLESKTWLDLIRFRW